jgi:E3 ubiquitin-protein ligase BRE1
MLSAIAASIYSFGLRLGLTVSVDLGSFPSELLFADHERFASHLETRSKEIKSTIAQLFKNASKFAPISPDVRELQSRIAKLLASEKAHSTELDRVRAEKEQLEERLENASLRYMVAEKKLDRAKSQSVAKLERQAIFGGGNEASGESSNKHDASDLVNGVNGEVNADADAGRREALAVAIKQKDQLEKLEAENEKLSGEITTMKVKVRHSLHRESYSCYEHGLTRV